MMDQNLLSRVKKALNSQFYFMNNDWFVECVEYYINTHPNAKDQQIIAFVKSQWQLSDLREINNENGCLPPNLTQQKVTALRGTYILQMEKMYDSATSKYKQLEQIRNVSTANIEATEENEEKQPWEPKKKRMVYMYLTDGIQNITAMEYKTVTCLHDGLLPGHKVMIVGPIQCRRGVLLLEEGKFKEVGGEVDNLLIPNALENVLARALGLPENPDPYGTYNAENNDQNNDNVQVDNLFEDDFEIDLDQIEEIERKSQETGDGYNSNTRTDDSSNLRQVSGPSSSRREIENEGLNLDDDDMIEILDDDEINFNIPQSSTNSQNKQQKSCLPSVKQQDISEIEDAFVDDFDIDDIELISYNASEIVEPNAENKMTRAEKRSANTENTPKSNSFSNKISCINDGKQTGTNDTGSPCRTSVFQSNRNKSLSSAASPQNTISKNDKRNTPTNKKHGGIVASPSTSITKGRSSQENLKRHKGERKISDFIGKIATPPKPEIPKICDFICEILAQNITETIFRTIRGQTVRLGKLSKKDHCWQLEATITDRTASLDVTFSSKVLEELIGLNVKQFLEQKKLVKGNPTKDEELRMRFRKAEAKLENLDALLELELTESNAKPKIMKITSLTSEQKEVIDKRLKMFKM